MELARRQENEDGGPWGGQELRGELKTHRACEPDGGFENKKKRTGKENRKQTYLEERRKKEILGGGPDEGREPRPGPRIVWAHPPEEIKPEIKVRVRERNGD
jgi:hypothetical protein